MACGKVLRSQEMSFLAVMVMGGRGGVEALQPRGLPGLVIERPGAGDLLFLLNFES